VAFATELQRKVCESFLGNSLQPPFFTPYLYSDYGIYLGSNLSEVTERWPVTNVTAKIQAFPRRPHNKPNLGDQNQEWYLISQRQKERKVFLFSI
jgi:hypothetical protein